MPEKLNNSGCLIGAGLIAVLFSFLLFGNEAGGAGLFFIILGVVLIVIGNNGSNPSTQANTLPQQQVPPVRAKSPPGLPPGLELLVTINADRIEGMPVNMLRFSTKGFFFNRNSIKSPCFECRMTDVTDVEIYGETPILSFVDDLQDEDSTEFRYQLKFSDQLNPGSGSVDWINFASIPREVLVFPTAGNRKIKTTLRVLDLSSGKLVATANTVWSTLVEGTGYLEVESEESEAQAACLKLAMCIAAADGTVDDHEVLAIQTWGIRTVNALPSSRQELRRSTLNEALTNASREIRANRTLQVEAAAVSDLKERGEMRFLYDAYELCLHVIKADGAAHPEEMAQLTRIAKLLGLDETKVRILTDRHLSEVKFTAVEESDDDHILGITDDMSKDQIRKHLNKLFQKHQARTQHDNPEVVRKAKEWLERIAKARVRHLG